VSKPADDFGRAAPFSRVQIFFEDGKMFPLIRSWISTPDFVEILKKIWSARPDLVQTDVAEALGMTDYGERVD
jgi:hypothetical protein